MIQWDVVGASEAEGTAPSLFGRTALALRLFWLRRACRKAERWASCVWGEPAFWCRPWICRGPTEYAFFPRPVARLLALERRTEVFVPFESARLVALVAAGIEPTAWEHNERQKFRLQVRWYAPPYLRRV